MAINIKPSHKGLLHKNLGVPQGRKIPASKLAVKSTDSEAVRKRKQFAINAKKWKHEDGGFIDNRSLPEYKDGGPVKPIVVTDPNDPRLKAYNDSLNLYNSTSKVLSTLSDWNNSPTDKNKEKYWAAQEFNMNGDRENWVKGKRIKPLDETNAPWTKQNAPDGNPDFYYNYKKPVQPVEYQAPTQQPKKLVAKPTPTQQPTIPAEAPVINKDTIYQTPVMHQGYRNWQNGIKPGLYAKGGPVKPMLDKFTGDPVGGEVPTGTVEKTNYNLAFSKNNPNYKGPYADYGHGQTEPGLQDASLDAYMMFAPGVEAIGKGIGSLVRKGLTNTGNKVVQNAT